MPIKKFIIDHLDSGGVITNYYCSSNCRHCLYACGPRWKKIYMDELMAETSMKKIKSLGCNSIHVGGGESFLNLDGLKIVLGVAERLGLNIEYVETNSSWYQDKRSACKTLLSLKKRGLSTLLISMSPFHNEYIPFYKVKGVLEACREAGVSPFPWMPGLYHEIDFFNEKSTHSLSEYTNRYGEDYLKGLPSRYWIHLGGRALQTFSKVLSLSPLENIINSNAKGCSELLNVSHFHIDLFGNYIPGLCSGLSINCKDIGVEIPEKEYPFLTTLYFEGIEGFLDIASRELGFRAVDAYLSKCHLCFDIRKYLTLERETESSELQPKGIYKYL
ncbi:radical SAM protein [Thermodesulfobacteriota bacterium]